MISVDDLATSTVKVDHKNTDVSVLRFLPQWIYPSQLLDSPQNSFEFQRYPQLSAAMKVYMRLGKIIYQFLILGLAIYGTYSVIEGFRGVLLLPILFIVLLIMNLIFAFHVASGELVKVIVSGQETT